MEKIENLGFGFLGDHTAEEMVELSVCAEYYGYSSVWLAEDYFYAGAFSLAATVAAKTNNVQIGLGVLNPFTRHPVLTAMESAALDKVSNGRAIIGLGSSNRLWMEKNLGIPFKKPLTSTKECAEIIKKLLRDKSLTYHGEVFNVEDVKLDFEPYREDMPVYLGVQGDKALFLAGQVADGLLISAGCTVEFISYAKKIIAEGARSVGRDPNEIKIAAYLVTYIGNTHEQAVNLMRNYTEHYVGMHGARPILTCAGFKAEEVQPFKDARMRGEKADLPITDEMVEKVTLTGTKEEVRKRVEEFIAAGVDYPICFEVGKGIDTKEQMKLIKEALL